MGNREPPGDSDASDADRIERQRLLDRLERGEGRTEDAERWLARLKENDPLCESSDHLLALKRTVRARRVLDKMVADGGSQLARDQLVALVGKVQRGEGTEEEISAWLTLIERNVPHPEVRDLIYGTNAALLPEEIVARALAYKPVILGPAEYQT